MARALRCGAIAVLAMLGACASAPGAIAQDAEHAFLDRLVGCWRLEGQMGDVALHQSVQARWVLGGQFVEMRFVQTDPPDPSHAPYEALYLVGYDPSAQRYVLNLFDTFGVSAAPIPGVGVREGDAIGFVFPYVSGEFRNNFSWSGAGWEMRLEQRQPDGSFTAFATKRLTRC